MPNFLKNRWTQVAIVAFAAAAIFMVLQSGDAENTTAEATTEVTTTEATAATEQASAETAPVINSTTNNDGDNAQEAVNNTANTDNINQVADETTNEQ